MSHPQFVYEAVRDAGAPQVASRLAQQLGGVDPIVRAAGGAAKAASGSPSRQVLDARVLEQLLKVAAQITRRYF
jgi:hypothetical protein